MKKLIISFFMLTFFSRDVKSAICVYNLADTTVPQKKYSELITTNAIVSKGLFTVSEVDGHYYFEIPDKLYEKDLLFVTRVKQGSANSNIIGPILPGDEVNNLVIRFQKAPDNKIFLRKSMFTIYGGDSSSMMFKAVNRSQIRPIVAALSILTKNPSTGQAVVDMTDQVLGASELFSFSDLYKGILSITTPVKETSFIDSVICLPKNIEIISVKTYKKTQVLFQGISGTEDLTFEFNTSIIELPELPMKSRLEDQRVGYFSLREVDYSTNANGVKKRSYIKRWRLEPKPEDIGKYMNGETVTPRQPIIFYIDPATPVKWVPYLKQGVEDWNVAFEKAGFKNAISALPAPIKENDSAWSLYDASHSAIVYKPSEMENASGPSIADPRTGEILESHINWYHNVMRLIHNWYMIQCGATDPKARKMHFDDSLMGQLIRFVSSHEVGHTLGLTHNMGSSSTVSTEKLRDKKWVEENGICNSIMDYARFNYVAQPSDSISERGLFPRIGLYDKWAIEWGYRWFPEGGSEDSEKTVLAFWTSQKLRDNRLWYGPEGSWDPRSQTEDLGDNPVLSSEYGIANLKRVVPELIVWTSSPGGNYEDLNESYLVLQSQYTKYLRHVYSNLSGLYETVKNVDQPGPVYSPIPVIRQKEAVSFLNRNFFKTPYWLLDSAVLARTGQTALGVIGQINSEVFSSIFHATVMAEKLSRERSNYPGQFYSVEEMLSDMKKGVWTEIYAHKPINIFRMNLQNAYVTRMIQSTYAGAGLNTDVLIFLPISGPTSMSANSIQTIVYGHLLELKSDILKGLPFQKDRSSIYHLKYILQVIDANLKESAILIRRK